jgi:predicted aconitase with swiveling domain
LAVKAFPLIPGEAQGAALMLRAPISFWGGIDPGSGIVIDVRHPDRGVSVAGMILGLPGMIGSSSASSVLLELIRIGRAPAALLLDAPDAVLLLGSIVAREMGWAAPPAFRLPAGEQRRLSGKSLWIACDGTIEQR